MNARIVGSKRRWALAAAGAGTVVGLVVLYMRIIVTPAAVPQPRQPAEGPAISRRVELVREQNESASIYDQTPLFLSTERNVSLPLPPRPEAGQSVLDQDAVKLTFGASELNLGLTTQIKVPQTPAEMLAETPPAPLFGFGRTGRELVPLAKRGGLVQVLGAETNRSLLSAELPIEAAPPAGERPWRPVEFLAAVNATGLADLRITERSGVEEVDNYFRIYLARTFRVGERVAPGFYRIVVGP